jgi:26S proteasome non-ATPase regulatory subunit 10
MGSQPAKTGSIPALEGRTPLMLDLAAIAFLACLAIAGGLSAADAPSGIHAAAGTGDVTRIKQLAEADRSVLSESSPGGGLPLHTAAATGQQPAVETLLSLGAEVDGRDGQGATALHSAASAGEADIVDLLLSKGADLRAVDASGMTTLHFATYGGHTALAADASGWRLEK